MRLIDAVALAQEVASLRVTIAGRPAAWDEAKSDVLRVIDEQKTVVAAADVLRNQWISVKDRLPATEDEVLVLTMSKNGNINVDKGYFANGRFVYRGRAEVTHWMPLPLPPEE